MVGAGAARYDSSSFTSTAFQVSTPSTTTSRASPPNRPSALQAATASSPEASAACRCSVASSPIRARRRWSATPIFGRSVPVRR